MRHRAKSRLAWLAACVGLGCGAPRGEPVASGAATTITAGTTVGPSTGTVASSGGADADDTAGDKLDVNDPVSSDGCQAIDFLFVIDNSDSMATYQLALAEQFPDFVGAMVDVLPPQIDVHVGITTTDFDAGCTGAESTSNCQSTATIDEVEAHYVRPDVANDAGNGTQGRLFKFGGIPYFATTSDADPAPLSTWFSQAAVAAGEDGCSFEMPVAAAGFAAHPANVEANAGFIRDAGALLVLFFLTDEPDKSPESKSVYAAMLTDAKLECGGADCIFVSGLIPSCTSKINQKLWQFMTEFADGDAPPWGDINATSDYSQVFGDALADAIAARCAQIPIP